MTTAKLHKLLGKLIREGHGRMQVCIDKSKCTHPLEGDGVCVIPITSVEVQTHELLDDDGGWKVLSSGRVAERTALVIEAGN
jgi:hypothetical protein